MYALAPRGVEGVEPGAAASANIDAYQEVLGVQFPPSAVATVAAAFASMAPAG
jgi:hypothetical protein